MNTVAGALAVLWLVSLLLMFLGGMGSLAPVAGHLARAIQGPYDFTDFPAIWLEHARGAGVAAWLLLTACGAGRVAVALLGIRSGGARPSGLLFAMAAGFALLGTGVFGAGLTGLLHPVPLGVAVAVFGVAGLRGVWKALGDLAGLRPKGALAALFACLALLICLACLAPALAPELGWDALTYHLHVPERYLAAGRVFVMPYNLASFFPFLPEMWFMLGQMMGGEAAAKCLNFSFLPMTCLALAAFGREAGDRTAGWLAALLYAGIPAVALMAGQCYSDLEIAFLSLLAVRAACARTGAWRVLSGVLCGAALASKYLGAWTLLGCLIPWIAYGPAGRKRITALVAPLAVAGLLGAPWLIRNLMLTGSPVYPLFAGALGAGDWNPYIPAAMIPGPAGPSAVPDGLFLSLLRSPLTVSVSGRATGVPLSPLLLGFLPAFLLVSRPGKGGWALTGAGLVGAGLWAVSGSGEGRYLLPAFALLALPAASGARALLGAGALLAAPSACALAVGIAVQMTAWTGHVSQMYVPWRVAAGVEPRDLYLSRALLPNSTYYPLAKRVRSAIPKRARILLFSDIVGHYFDRDTVFDRQELMPPVAVRLLSACHDPFKMRKRFRQLGLEYVLYTPRTAAMQEACGCVRFSRRARDCYGRFWRRYASLELEQGAMRLYRIRSEASASRGERRAWRDWPGVQDEVQALILQAPRTRRAPPDFSEANRELASLSREVPDLSWVWVKRAEMRVREGDFASARRELDRARALGADGAAYWLALGAIRTDRGDFPGAADASAQAVKRHPAPATWALHALKLAAAGRGQAAREAAREAMRLNPFSRYARMAAARTR